jgi:hypothetical protein
MYFDICNEDAPLFQAVKSATAAKKDDSFANYFPRNGWEGVFCQNSRSHRTLIREPDKCLVALVQAC